MWKKVNRQIRAGAITGIIYPAIWSGYLLFEAPEWRTPSVLLLTILLALIAGAGIGTIFRGIEKIVSRRISLNPTILVALIASLFISAFFTSAQ